tara:strand:+ start:861 stop:1013 length:153 start_codon:yes stop_codon:yes gene_type:complete
LDENSDKRRQERNNITVLTMLETKKNRDFYFSKKLGSKNTTISRCIIGLD